VASTIFVECIEIAVDTWRGGREHSLRLRMFHGRLVIRVRLYYAKFDVLCPSQLWGGFELPQRRLKELVFRSISRPSNLRADQCRVHALWHCEHDCLCAFSNFNILYSSKSARSFTFPAEEKQSAKYVFTHFEPATGTGVHNKFYVFLLGMLMSQFTLCAYDVSNQL
jgi:hypothetical protein